MPRPAPGECCLLANSSSIISSNGLVPSPVSWYNPLAWVSDASFIAFHLSEWLAHDIAPSCFVVYVQRSVSQEYIVDLSRRSPYTWGEGSMGSGIMTFHDSGSWDASRGMAFVLYSVWWGIEDSKERGE